MSAAAQCPLCGHASKQVEMPHPYWGLAFSDAHAEQVMMSDYEVSQGDGTLRRGEGTWSARVGAAISHNMHELGRQTFWCPCGRMLWMAGRGWMVSLDFILNLAKGLRDMRPSDLANLLVSLSVLMPQEIDRLRKLVDP